MATPQQAIDNLIPGVSVFNLALNVAGAILNKKNVALYIINPDKTKTDILQKEGILGTVGNYTEALSIFGSNGVVIDCSVIESSKLAEHPLEDGMVRADNKVTMPTTAAIKIVMPASDYKDMLEKIREYRTSNQMLCLECKYGTFKNMQIVEIPCDLTVENVSRVTFTLKLRQVLTAQNKQTGSNTANASDSKTVNTGAKTGESRAGVFVAA